ncbi:MAG TPA: ABC transporter permease [Kofleriaceae bacterium]|jgi:ABC-type antimicrobial peptide transport system permease subunit|nr:ABC transporter permease [Kofleriaceae bacterium]
MMPAGNLVRMVAANTLRSRRHFVLSAFGIVIGIATFVVFLASTEQVGAVLEKIFPVEQVQVVAPRASLLGKDISKKLDDAIVEKIRSRPEVDRADPTAVVPRMALAFPAFGRGSFEGNDLKFEVGGFADGINPAYVDDDDRTRELFKDWDGVKDDPRRVACTPPPPDPNEDVIQSPRAVPRNRPAEPGVYYNPCPSPDRYYCDDDRTCHHRVPVVMSPTMIELYNGQFAKSHGLPIADLDFVKFVTQRGGLGSMRFSVGLGLTTIAGSNAVSVRKARRVEAVLVGISTKSMPIGMTMPIEYIQRWNREFLGDAAATTYSSIIVRLKDKNRIAVFSQWLQDELDLRLEDSLGEKFATALFVIRLVLILISLVIIAISSINIAHNFFMQVTERRRELGLLRAVGATQSDVLWVVLGEAALIGLIGGVIGLAIGVGLAAGIDWGSAHYLPRFPYKPSSWFHFKWWIVLGGLACSTGFSVLGGYLPARRASTMEPAQALTQN